MPITPEEIQKINDTGQLGSYIDVATPEELTAIEAWQKAGAKPVTSAQVTPATSGILLDSREPSMSESIRGYLEEIPQVVGSTVGNLVGALNKGGAKLASKGLETVASLLPKNIRSLAEVPAKGFNLWSNVGGVAGKTLGELYSEGVKRMADTNTQNIKQHFPESLQRPAEYVNSMSRGAALAGPAGIPAMIGGAAIEAFAERQEGIAGDDRYAPQPTGDFGQVAIDAMQEGVAEEVLGEKFRVGSNMLGRAGRYIVGPGSANATPMTKRAAELGPDMEEALAAASPKLLSRSIGPMLSEFAAKINDYSRQVFIPKYEQLQGVFAKKINDYLGDLSKYPGGSRGSIEFGQDMKTLFGVADEASSTPINEQYNKLFDIVNSNPVSIARDSFDGLPMNVSDIGTPVRVGFLKDFIVENFGSLSDLKTLFTDTGNRQAADLVKKFGEHIPDVISFQDARQLRSSLMTAIRKTKDPTKATQIQGGLSSQLTDALTTSLKEANLPELIPQFKAMDKLYRERMDNYREGIIQKVVAQKRPELVADMIFKPGDVTTTERVFNEFRGQPEILNRIRRAAFEQHNPYSEVHKLKYADQFDTATGLPIGEKAIDTMTNKTEKGFIDWWKSMEPEQKRYLAKDAEHLTFLENTFRLLDESQPAKNIEHLKGKDLHTIGQVAGLSTAVLGSAASVSYLGNQVSGDENETSMTVGGGIAGAMGALMLYMSPSVFAKMLSSKAGARAMVDIVRPLRDNPNPTGVDIVKMVTRMGTAKMEADQELSIMERMPVYEGAL